MTLIKTGLLNGVAVLVRLLTLLGINKLMAIYVGPAGYAALGQFQNAITIITTFANGAITTGVIKYTAEDDNEERQCALWKTAGTVSLLCSVITALLIAVFSKSLAVLFLKEERYASVFLWFAGMLIFFVFNSLLLAILNGKKDIRRYVIANISGSILALLITAVLLMRFGLYGALTALAVYQSFAFFVTLVLCYNAPWFRLNYLFGTMDPVLLKNLLKYAFMAIVSAICVPASQVLIRNYIGDTLGWDAAGNWEAVTRLSTAYLTLVTTTLSVYYLPKLSSLHDPSEIKSEICHIYKVVLPVATGCSLFVYFFRNAIVSVLFTQNFTMMEELFAWQLIGDTIKIASWVLAYVYIAKNFMRLYVVSEVIFSLLFYLLVIVLERKFHFKAVVLAYAVTYLLHFIFVYISLKLYRVI